MTERRGAATRTRIAMAAALAVTVTIVAGCGDDDTDAEPDAALAHCEERLAAGTAYRHDPALAIAISRAIEVSHPELSPLVDTVAEAQADRPDRASLDLQADGLPADASFDYVATLIVLSEQPALATPEALAALQDAAGPDGVDHVAGVGGLGGVAAVVGRPHGYVPSRYDVPELVDLGNEVQDRAGALVDTGIRSITSESCRAP
jgi:hypothetical protein